MLRGFLRLISDWASAGFPVTTFEGTAVHEAFGAMLEHTGQDEIDRLLASEDYLLAFNAAPREAGQLGGPRATEILTELVERLLDYWYLAVHGDYAFAVAEWLESLEPRPFGSVLGDPAQAELWQLAGALNWCRHIARRQEAVRAWTAEKPTADPVSWPEPQRKEPEAARQVNANSFVIRRLEFLRQLLPPAVAARVTLNAGAYPRGGRKPPSRTHGTTFGADLDCGVDNVESLRGLQEKNAADIFRKIMKNVEQPIRSPYTLFGTKDWERAVILTQAVLLTSPSRLYFGDYLVLVAAFGGLSHQAEAKNRPLPFRTFLKYEPLGHHNHWHVDWLPARVLAGYERPAPPTALFDVKWQSNCIEKGQESVPLRKRAELVRPVRIGEPKVLAPELDAFEKDLSEIFGYGTAEFSLPIGPVNDPASVREWVDRFFFDSEAEEAWIH